MKKCGHGRKSAVLRGLDWVLLGILLLAVASGAWLLAGDGEKAEDTVFIRYRIDVGEASREMAEAWRGLSVGSAVTNENGTAELGRVELVEISPAPIFTVRDGEIVTLESKERMNVTVTVCGQGSDAGALGLRILSHRIAAGYSGSFQIGSFYAPNARILHVEVLQ